MSLGRGGPRGSTTELAGRRDLNVSIGEPGCTVSGIGSVVGVGSVGVFLSECSVRFQTSKRRKEDRLSTLTCVGIWSHFCLASEYDGALDIWRRLRELLFRVRLDRVWWGTGGVVYHASSRKNAEHETNITYREHFRKGALRLAGQILQPEYCEIPQRGPTGLRRWNQRICLCGREST